MSTITWPTLSADASALNGCEFGIKSNTQVSISDLSGYIQTVELPGARWTLSGGYAPLERADAALIEAFLAQLRGQANRAAVPLFGRKAPRGTWAGSPIVDNEAGVGSPVALQTGTSLICTGFSAGATVKIGDYFNIGANGELKIITADGTASGAGLLTLAFEPPIRTSPAQSTAIISTNCTMTMMATDPHLKWGRRLGELTEFAFDFVETW